MTVEIHIPVEPISVNATSQRDKRFKSVKYRQWETMVLLSLTSEDSQQKLQQIRDAYEHGSHSFEVELTAHYPRELYFTKSGVISNRTLDNSNWEKPIIDLLFLPKYHELKPPSGAPNINVDDRYITSLLSRKLPYDKSRPCMVARIALVPAPQNSRETETP